MMKPRINMTYYSREILEQYLKDTRLNKILDIIDETEPYLVEGKTVPANINVRFCRDCPKFDINGIQPDPGITHGLCLRFSDEHVPYYVRVKDSDFCNEDNIGD